MSAFNEGYRFGSAHWADEISMRPLREASGLYLGSMNGAAYYAIRPISLP